MPPGEHELTAATALRVAASDWPEGTFSVVVERGPDAGRSVELDGSAPAPLLVGKSSLCDLRLTDPEVSRRHLSLELVGSKLRVIDLGSTNGTFLGTARLGEALLAGGELLVLGATVLRIERHATHPNPLVPHASSFGRLLGSSRAMRRLYFLCRQLAQSSVPVVIEGETGTGKELLAEVLHEEGARSSGPFLLCDCASLRPSQAERILFGESSGEEATGLFEQASGGTLCLDEVSELSPSLQGQLLRAVERGEIRRVDSARPLRVDVRVIALSRRNLDQEVQAGRLREDLFYRLAVGRITMPPLRSRAGDITLLARHFWSQCGGQAAPPEALLARFEDTSWPGNVRELRNAVARAVVQGIDGPERELSGSSDPIDEILQLRLPLAEARQRVIDFFERRYLEQLLADHGGNVTHAAAASGIARRHLQRLRAKQRG